MFDGGADLGPGSIGALALVGERLAGRSAEMDLRDEAGTQDGAFVLLAAIGRIRPDRAAWLADQVRMKPWRWSMPRCDLYPNRGVAISAMNLPSGPFLRRPRLSVQRASRSFCASLAGFAAQA
ncbi:hypothetical protein ACFSHP_20390 [Novosphingobium panipatense]